MYKTTLQYGLYIYNKKKNITRGTELLEHKPPPTTFSNSTTFNFRQNF